MIDENYNRIGFVVVMVASRIQYVVSCPYCTHMVVIQYMRSYSTRGISWEVLLYSLISGIQTVVVASYDPPPCAGDNN